MARSKPQSLWRALKTAPNPPEPIHFHFSKLSSLNVWAMPPVNALSCRTQSTLLVFYSRLLSWLKKTPKGLLTIRRQNKMKQVWRGGTTAVGEEYGSNFSSGTITAQEWSSTSTAEASVIVWLLLRCLCLVLFPIGIIGINQLFGNYCGGDFNGLPFRIQITVGCLHPNLCPRARHLPSSQEERGWSSKRYQSLVLKEREHTVKHACWHILSAHLMPGQAKACFRF